MDDDPLVRELLRAVLEGEHIVLDEAADGAQALRLAERHPPDLVLLDVMMPGMNGYDVCRAMRRAPGTAGTKIVMLSARASAADVEAGMQAGADDYVAKPFSPLDLLELVP